jgi:methylenetetrahydrofolate reductase (NADPH)
MNEADGMTPDAATRFAAVLASGRFAITAEIAPPLSCDPDDVIRTARPLKGLADAVNVTDGAGARAHMGAAAAAAILAREGIEPIQQFTCRDRNRIALQGDLLAAAALGVRNILLLRGDDPTAGDQPDAKPVFDLDTVGLLRTAAGMRERGEMPSGRKLNGRPAFFLGVADTPIDPPDGWAPHALAAKAAAGAQFVQTQFCMDAGIVRRYLRRLDEHGVLARLSILIGVAPLKSARSARWMRKHLPGTIIPNAAIARLEGAANPAAEGRRLCVELMQELAEIPGVAGAHVMAPANAEAIPEVLAEAARMRRRMG